MFVQRLCRQDVQAILFANTLISAVTPQKVFELTTQKIDSYNRDGSSKELLTELLGAESSLAAVVQVSDLSFTVRGFPSTNNTLGYSHVKIVDSVLVCSSKDTDCKSFVVKGKYECTKNFVFISTPYSVRVAIVKKPFGLPPLLLCLVNQQHRRSVVKCVVNLSRKIASHFITPALLKVVDEKNTGGWSSSFSPMTTCCELCGDNLGEDVKHPGNDGLAAYLVTTRRPLAKVDIRVRVCQSNKCKAMHQAVPWNIGE